MLQIQLVLAAIKPWASLILTKALSRKLAVTIAGLAAVYSDIPPDKVYAMVWLICGYVGGQSIVDAVKELPALYSMYKEDEVAIEAQKAVTKEVLSKQLS